MIESVCSIRFRAIFAVFYQCGDMEWREESVRVESLSQARSGSVSACLEMAETGGGASVNLLCLVLHFCAILIHNFFEPARCCSSSKQNSFTDMFYCRR